MANIIDKAIQLVFPEVNVQQSIKIGGHLSFELMSNNTVLFCCDDVPIDWFYSSCTLKDGTVLSTKTAKRERFNLAAEGDNYVVDIYYSQNKIQLIQHIIFNEENCYFTIQFQIHANKVLESNKIAAADFAYPDGHCHPLFSSLNERMLYVPYDNDMWSWYETGPLNSARSSYDVSVIYDKTNYQGLLIGALEFDFFKNVIKCSGYDARCFSAVSGVANEETHDSLPHGFVNGKKIASAAFVCGWWQDIREALEVYGTLAGSVNKPEWTHGVIFGWNSYSALTIKTTVDHYLQASEFLGTLNDFKTEEGTTYINFDFVAGISNSQMKQAVKKIHERGQKAGTYLAPLCHLPIQDHQPLKGSLLHFRNEVVLKKPDGSNYEPIDGKYPIDITNPLAENDLRKRLQDIVEAGFDYVKIDFLSHGAVEGVRCNKEIKTGRQALNYFYNIVAQELDPEKTGREIFVSLSIAPLFPCNFGHARRCCCDSFGHSDDSAYILNALNFGWWTNGSIYQYNDPDHTVLYQSAVDSEGPTSLLEAKSRYNASIISGTVMLLSDNYGPDEDEQSVEKAKERAVTFTSNQKLNEIARFGKAFKPYRFHNDNSIFYLNHQGRTFVAIFNFESEPQIFTIDPLKINAPPQGTLEGLSETLTANYNKQVKVKIAAYDSLILEFRQNQQS